VKTTYNVEGMTCEHCINAVTDELKNIETVTDVSIDLATGLVEVTSEDALVLESVKRAVEEAGYELVSQQQ